MSEEDPFPMLSEPICVSLLADKWNELSYCSVPCGHLKAQCQSLWQLIVYLLTFFFKIGKAWIDMEIELSYLFSYVSVSFVR